MSKIDEQMKYDPAGVFQHLQFRSFQRFPHYMLLHVCGTSLTGRWVNISLLILIVKPRRGEERCKMWSAMVAAGVGRGHWPASRRWIMYVKSGFLEAL